MVAKIKVCKECGVPKLVSKGLIWRSDGTIVEKKDPDHRMLFCESENLEALFAGVESIIGMSIEKIVIESKRRVTREYLEKMIPALARKLIYFFRASLIAEKMGVIGGVHGYGHIDMVKIQKHTERGDYLLMTIENPYSIRFFRGDNLGGMEAASGRECTVEEKQIGEDKFQLEMWVGEHPPELQERLKLKAYPLKPGDLVLERCPKCGVPLAVAAYHWNLETGTITHPQTGVRMALFGPVGLEAIFSELVQTYGITIPQICEAASYSMAMVVRVALGLSADRAVIGALVTDSLSGWTALAAVRHLVNAGSVCQLVGVQLPDPLSEQFKLQLRPLEKMGAELVRWNDASQNPQMSQLVLDCHAVLCGLFSASGPPGAFEENIAGVINELQTPIHTIQCPLGVDPDDGSHRRGAIVSSSTISLGMPLMGLHKAHDFVGRHYLCDISLTRQLYQKGGSDLTPLFAEQPVIQIFPA